MRDTGLCVFPNAIFSSVLRYRYTCLYQCYADEAFETSVHFFEQIFALSHVVHLFASFTTWLSDLFPQCLS